MGKGEVGTTDGRGTSTAGLGSMATRFFGCAAPPSRMTGGGQGGREGERSREGWGQKGRGRAKWPAPFGVSVRFQVTRLGDDYPRLVGVDPVGCASFYVVLILAPLRPWLWIAYPAFRRRSCTRRALLHRCWRSNRWWRSSCRLHSGPCLPRGPGSSPACTDMCGGSPVEPVAAFEH